MSRTVAVDLILNGTIQCNNTIACSSMLTTGPLKIKRTTITANYTVVVSDYLIGVNTTTGAITITLPVSTTTPNQVFYIKDEGGTCDTNNISITTNNLSPDTIDGVSTVVLNSRYGSLTLYSNGVNKYFII